MKIFVLKFLILKKCFGGMYGCVSLRMCTELEATATDFD